MRRARALASTALHCLAALLALLAVPRAAAFLGQGQPHESVEGPQALYWRALGVLDSKPYLDTCLGTPKAGCKRRGICTWDETYSPECYTKALLSKTSPWRDVPDFVLRFFVFHYGVHLSEGTMQRWYYNVSPEECARMCVRSAAGLPKMGEEDLPNPQLVRVRCLSFDFYPFENSADADALDEDPARGVCSINSGSKLTARLRNVDQGCVPPPSPSPSPACVCARERLAAGPHCPKFNVPTSKLVHGQAQSTDLPTPSSRSARITRIGRTLRQTATTRCATRAAGHCKSSWTIAG